MKKSNFAALILGTIGMVFFALGMCMALIEEWGMFRQGVIAGVIGLVILLITLIVWRRMEGKEPIHLSGKTVGTIILSLEHFYLELECVYAWYLEKWYLVL